MIGKKPVKAPAVIKQSADEALEYADSIINTLRDPLLALGSDLRVIKANHSFFKTFNVTPAETLGQLIYDLGNKEWDIPKLRDLLESILPEKSVFSDYEVEHDFNTIGRRTMLLNARQVQGLSGKEQVILLAIEDITKRKGREASLEKTYYQELEAIKIATGAAGILTDNILNTAREPLLALDSDLRVIKASHSFFKTFNMTPAETLGQLIYDLGNKEWDIPKLRDLLESILPEKSVFSDYEVEHDFNTIGRRTMLLNARQVQGLLGKEQVILLAIEDITKRKQDEDALVESRQSLIDAQRLARVGSWEWNATEDVIRGSKEFYQLFDVIPEEIARFGQFVERLHPEDRDRVQRDVDDALRQERIYDTNYRVKLHGDGWRDINARGRTFTDTDGKAVRMVGTVQDITERKKAEDALRDSGTKYRTLIENLPQKIFIKDRNSVYISCNENYVRDFKFKAEAIAGKTDYDFYPKGLAEKYRQDDKMVIEAGIIEEFEEKYINDGRESWVHTTKAPVKDEKGNVIGLIGIFWDITENKLAEEKLIKSYESLKKTFNDAITTMSKIVELRDPYTAGHQQRVAGLATAIAVEMKLEETRIDQVTIAAIIHDIGKMYVPSDLLSKPGRLSDIEFDLIKTHSQNGYDIVEGMHFPGVVAQAILQHHERLDGSGYPDGLKGEDTLLEAKILAVADVIEAMSSHRPYRPALGIDKALEEISDNRDKLYDPAVVDACMKLFNEKGFKFE